MKQFNRFCFLTMAGICLFFMLSAPLGAKDKKSVAVLPFAVNSMDNIDYVQQGIQVMLASRIAGSDRIEVVSKDKVADAAKTLKLKEMTLADINGLGKKMAVDYVVAGTITKIGNSVSIDGRLVDIAADKPAVTVSTQSQGMDDVIVKINDFALRIEQHILGTAPAAVAGPVPSVATTAALPQITAPGASPSQKEREGQIIAGMRTGKKATFTGAINPDFISGAQPRDKRGFWMSQKYPTNYKGIDVGDVNGDGRNEMVVIDE
ncbi:MAG TPA: hypothetical protein PLU95_05635, partial [Syntrophales bacterium]|nr:hypothetical protein [Syntrophales bacterium]